MHAPADTAPVTYLKVSEVAVKLNLSVRHVYELINRRELKSVRMGRPLRIRSDDLAEYEDSLRGT